MIISILYLGKYGTWHSGREHIAELQPLLEDILGAHDDNVCSAVPEESRA